MIFVQNNYERKEFEFEAAVRFELTNKGFADLRLRPLGNAAIAPPNLPAEE